MANGSSLLPSVFDDMDVGITLHDPDTGGILDVNTTLEEIYGYPARELREMAVEDYSAPSTEYSQQAAVSRIRAAASGNPQTFEWQVKRSNGELRWVSVHLNATVLADRRCVLAEIHDISEYKAREQRLQLLSRVIRHNLRNEMTAIMGYAERIQTAIEDDTLADAAETVLDIANEVGTLSDSIRELEEIAEPTATKRAPQDLNALVASIVESTTEDYPDVTIEMIETADVWVVADHGLRHAVRHAVKNAIEHNDADQPTVTVTVADESETEFATLEIADNGPTIPAVEIDVLREEVEPTETYHGSGIGLWIIFWCVRSLGGEFEVDENRPRGNIVRLRLPTADEARE